jgi:hypothetical protein
VKPWKSEDPMQKFAILHTTPVTVQLLTALAEEMLPGWEILNYVDDSILPQLASNGGKLEDVIGRLVHSTVLAEAAGAAGVLSACSSVGECVSAMAKSVSIPVVRIDEAMAEAAVGRGPRIGVAATVATTLNPTTRLILAKAAAAGKEVVLEPVLVSEAYQMLAAGDVQGHDRVLTAALKGLAQSVDVVALAQASMMRVLPSLPLTMRSKFLSSPRSGMELLKSVLEGHYAK